MALTRLTLRDFRNHAATRLEGMRAFNVLVGENGAGKTNVLEAVSLLAPGRGLRRAQPSEMAGRNGAGGFAVAAELEDGAVQIGTSTDPQAPNRRIVRINSAEGPAARLGEWLSITWLTPAMDRIFAESAGSRRRFLDRLVLARDPGHARNATRYETALRERNRLLGEVVEPDPLWLDGIEAQMAESGAALAAARAALVEDLGMALESVPEQPFARPSLSYSSDTPSDADALRAMLREGRRRDRAAGRSLSGPHRDDLAVTLAAKQAPAADCSTGEQKAMLIAIVLAHAGLTAGERPRLLLLDEIAAHLDPVRRTALFERLAQSGAQVWMTGTEIAPFAEIAGNSAVWTVRDGVAAQP
ncbi:DNA replication/repair protein RecF [Novosphingobium sp. B1]|uniref:DNA replication/repair protein RecF n=1 Tax=Novosphingobium sp. B1 TaxID=1938756 RepID=UPI0009D8969E|nr:DNA replication/repair protein RecF [Novosphingobium sp. B1]SMC48315.1 DNA replication and repair protein RecF [Novosphingobium sp. B1]